MLSTAIGAQRKKGKDAKEKKLPSRPPRKEAHDLLAPVYNWFTEGVDTKDLKEGKAWLGAPRAAA